MAEYDVGGKPQKLTPTQIYAVARKGGFSKPQAVLATAIALAESGGDAHIVNDTPATGDLSYGLWQINMIGRMGPDRLKQFGIPSNEALADPVTNARAAYIVSGGGKNFNPWTTYTSGAYAKNLSTAADVMIKDNLNGWTWVDTVLGSIPVVGTYADWIMHPQGAVDAGKAVAGAASGAVGAVTGTVKFLDQLSNLGLANLLKLLFAVLLGIMGLLFLFHKQVTTAAAIGAMA